MTNEKNDKIVVQAAEDIMRFVYLELLRRRKEAQKSGKRLNEVICPYNDLFGFRELNEIQEKINDLSPDVRYKIKETRNKIYKYLTDNDYIELDDGTDERYCFILTEKGEKYVLEELIPVFYGIFDVRG